MNPARTTRSGENTSTARVTPASNAARSGKSRSATTAVGTPAARARSRAATPSRSLTTPATRKAAPDVAAASRRAWSRVPDPETRTTTRARSVVGGRCGTAATLAAPSEPSVRASGRPPARCDNGRVTTWPPNREALGERVRARTRLFGVLLAASVLTVFLPLPWRLAGLPFALATTVVGFGLLFALARWRRTGGAGGGAVGVSVGLGLASVLIVVNTVQVAFYPVLRDRERCDAQASTLQAKDRCQERFRPQLEVPNRTG